uniref:Uncharacterized protein n=1 Tax=Steinernema glaseri TaxID=37863 RepID=A0A1I7Z710_9BILA
MALLVPFLGIVWTEHLYKYTVQRLSYRLRSYHAENTRTRQISQVKQRRVRELVRSRKSSSVGPGQYLDRRRLGNPRCRKLFGKK